VIGEMMFLLYKHMHAASGVVSGIIRDLFHGKEIIDRVKVETQGLMLLDAPQPFPNYNDLPTQLLFKQVVVNSSYGKVQ
jgi:hypothetical protein